MTRPPPPTEEQRQTWMRQWRSAAIALEQVRVEELAHVDLAVVAAQLEDACLASVRDHSPGPTSGVIQQQRSFHHRWKA